MVAKLYNADMAKNLTILIYVVIMVAVIAGVDLLFFRHQFRERLIANIGIVIVFVALYLIFLSN